MSLLSVKNLTISFGASQDRKEVLHDVSFHINKDEILGVVGESGSGKSITSKAIMGLLPQKGCSSSGTLNFDGVDLSRLSEKEYRQVIGNQLSMIFQEPMTSLNPSLTCGFQVAEVLQQHTSLSKKEIKQEVLNLFYKVKLPRADEMYHQYPYQLSGGQKQRVMIAMAIACKPKLLIADEPTTALDVTVQKEIIYLLKDLQKETGMSIMFITHDLALVSEIAHHVLVMQKGKTVEYGEVEQVFHQPKEVYTKALINAKPSLEKRIQELPTVERYLENSFEEVLVSKEDRVQEHQDIYKSEPVLKVKNLKTYYGSNSFWSHQQLVKAVDDVSFEIFEGETVGLVGESGSGKSTIGRTILGLETATSGEVWYKGVDFLTLSAKKRKEYATDIQLIFQDPYSSLNPKVKVGKAILEPMIAHHKLNNNQERKEFIYELLEKVGLSKEHYHRYPHEFSGGQRQRIGIARALVLQPKLIICDESVSALDVSVQAQVLNLLNKLKKEYRFAYLFISHDLSVVKHMSDQLLVLEKGKLLEKGEADGVYMNPQTNYTRQLISSIPKGM